MTRILRDSITATDIPTDGTELVAGYGNGLYTWSPEDWTRFAGVPHATIDVDGSRPESDVLDVERGDASVQTAAAWVAKKWTGPIIYPPVIYASRDSLTPLFDALNAAGFEVGKHFRLWIATLDGTESVPDMTGVTAVQYQGAGPAGHFDQSIVYDDAWMPGVPRPAAALQPFPGVEWFHGAHSSPVVTAMGKRLVEEGCSAYHIGPGPQWTDADRQSYQLWQLKLGYTGTEPGEAADGWPGQVSWDKLQVPRVQ